MKENCFHAFFFSHPVFWQIYTQEFKPILFDFSADLELFHNLRKNGYLFTEELSKAKSVLIC